MPNSEASPNPSTYRALCVGIDRYQHLENNHFAVSDAVALHHSLKVHAGYVSRLSKPSRAAEFWAALDEVVQQAQTGDTVLVYVASHGVELQPMKAREDGTSEQVLLFPPCDPTQVVALRERAPETVPVLALVDHVERTAPQARWVFVIDACRSEPDALKAVQDRSEPDTRVYFRDITLRRARPLGSVQEETTANWSLVQSCLPGGTSHELERLQRGVLGWALQRAIEDAAQAGVGLWADDRFCQVLQALVTAALATAAPSRGQPLDRRLALPPIQLLPQRPTPRPLPPPAGTSRNVSASLWLAALALSILAAVMAAWFLAKRSEEGRACKEPAICMVPPEKEPPPPCPVCPPEPPVKEICDPKRPPGTACGRAHLEIWDGHQKLFWEKGSVTTIEWRYGDLSSAQPVSWRSLWLDDRLQSRWRSGRLSHVIVLGMASEELLPNLPGPQAVAEEEHRACQRAKHMLANLDSKVRPYGWAMVLGRHRPNLRDLSQGQTHKQRPVALVTVLDAPPGLGDDEIARQVSAVLATTWSRYLGDYSKVSAEPSQALPMTRSLACAR